MRKLLPYVGLLAVGVVMLAAVGRVWWTGHSELAAGRAALAAGEPVAAQNHFLTAGRSYVPLIGVQDDAILELIQLGETHLSGSRYPEAVAAFDDARGALYATAVLWRPDTELLGTADAGLARSLAAWKAHRIPGTDAAAAQARYLELTAAVTPPSGFWSLVMGLAFLCYVGCLGWLAWRWDRPDTRRWPWLAGAGTGFAIWIVAMLLI